MRRRILPVGSSALLAGLLVGCASDATVGLDRNGTLSLRFSRMDGGTASGAAVVQAGNVAVDIVQSLMVTITRVDALHAGADAEDEGAWVQMTLAAPVELDLLALPTDPGDAVVLPVGALAAGTYFNLRLILSDATIVFAEDVAIGGGPAAQTYLAGEEYAIRIAGPSQLRLLVPTASFEIPEGGGTDLDLFFDAGTSIGSVVATPNFLLMNPVLIARGGDDET